MERHGGSLADLVKLMKHAYSEHRCAVLCGPSGLHCCEILWSEAGESFVLSKDCEEDIDARSDAPGARLYRGWDTCTPTGKHDAIGSLHIYKTNTFIPEVRICHLCDLH